MFNIMFPGGCEFKWPTALKKRFGPGDVGVLPPGHDAWVIGDEEVVAIDISGIKEYAKPTRKKTAKKASKTKAKK
jgi:hypothetical protein